MDVLPRRSKYGARILLAWLACASSAIGQHASVPRKTFAPGEVHLNASRIYVYVGKTGFGHEHAIMGKLRSGQVHLGASEQAGKLVFDMESFVADTDEARRYVGLKGSTDSATQSKVTANMVGPHVLDAARFPTAEFDISSAERLPQPDQRGVAPYEFQGTLTLHGTARPVAFRARVEQRNGWNRLIGRCSILQSDFGITPFTMALGAVGVADQLTILGDIWIAPEYRGERPARTANR